MIIRIRSAKCLLLCVSVSSLLLMMHFYIQAIPDIGIFTTSSGLASSPYIHLIFVGCSITRYQYLALCESVKYGADALHTFFEAKVHATNDNIPFYDKWHKFYNKTAQYLNDTCECWRTSCCKQGQVMENRYFHDERKRFFASYFQWYSQNAMPYGYWKPRAHDSHACHMNLRCAAGDSRCFKRMEPSWNAERYQQNATSLSYFVEEIVMKLQPRPTHLVFEAGIHGKVNKAMLQLLFAQKAKYPDVEFIWKSNPKLRDGRIIADEPEKTLAKQHGWLFYNMSALTRNYANDDYYDLYHFKEHKYKVQNDKLFELMKVNHSILA